MTWLKQNLPIYKQVWKLALPVILTNILMTLVNIVDVFMVGRLGPVEIAAVGMASTIRLLVMVIIFSVVAGSMALAAQAKGARDPEKLSQVTRQSLTLMVLVALVLTLIGYFVARPLMTFLNSGGNPLAVELGSSYLELLFLGTVFLVANFMISSLMQGAGDTLTPLYLSGSINLLNIFFNYVFIFGPWGLPAFGVQGAAMGTMLARFIGTVAGFIIFYSGKNVIKILPGTYLPNWKLYKDILSIGIPSGLQGVVRNSAQFLVVRIVTSTPAGTYGAAALAVGLQIESLAFMPGLAINVAATSLVGQALGAWQVNHARQVGNASIILGIAVMVILGIPIFIFAPQLVLLFEPSANPVVLATGTSYLRINAIGLPTLALSMVVNGALRGAGDTRPGLFGNLLGRWLTVVPLAYLLGLTLNLGASGVWIALVAGTAVSGIYVLIRWRSDAWIDVALHKTEAYRQHLKKLPQDIASNYLDTIRTPIMALSDSTEHVEENSIHYHLPKGEISIDFSDESFNISQGKDLILEANQSSSLNSLS